MFLSNLRHLARLPRSLPTHPYPKPRPFKFSTFNDAHQRFHQQKFNPPSSKHNFSPKTCYYKLLNAGTSDDAALIRKQYLMLTKLYHPDINPDYTDQYMQINEAYEILSNKDLRKQYDLVQGKH
jgi:hypothetical protein